MMTYADLLRARSAASRPNPAASPFNPPDTFRYEQIMSGGLTMANRYVQAPIAPANPAAGQANRLTPARPGAPQFGARPALNAPAAMSAPVAGLPVMADPVPVVVDDQMRAEAIDVDPFLTDDSAILTELNRQAQQDLSLGGYLSGGEQRAASQAARAAYAARGMAYGTPAAVAEVLARDQFARQRQDQRRTFAGGVEEMNQAQAQANQQAAMQARLANQDAALRASLSNAQTGAQVAMSNRDASLQQALARFNRGADIGMANAQNALTAGQMNSNNLFQWAQMGQSAYDAGADRSMDMYQTDMNAYLQQQNLDQNRAGGVTNSQFWTERAQDQRDASAARRLAGVPNTRLSPRSFSYRG